MELARLLFWVTMVIGIFTMGGVYAKNGMYPYRLFEEGYRSTVMLIKEIFQTRPDMLRKQKYAGDGVTRYDPGLAYEGLTLMQGMYHEGVELRLVDMTGNVIHRWPADFFAIWPRPEHVIPEKNLPNSYLHYHTMGMSALPDGSVLINFSEKGTAKLDKCGNVQWTVDRMTHHAITPNPDGSYWIPVKGDVRELPDSLLLPGLSHESLMDSLGWYEDRLIRVDAGGHTTNEISVLQALFDGGFEREFYDVSRIEALDPTHVNDIEVVTPDLAGKITGVNAGDLLISIRNMHMLAIMDRDTGHIKWHQIGPWVRQHDPDITSNGNIVVYNNGDAHLGLNRTPGSNLIELDTATGQTSILYPRQDQAGFFTDIMGSHQLLPNGNRLITESMAGRVFEIDEQGNIVWEYIKPYDDSYASIIETAIRYDKDYFTVNDWSCH
jgi:hypothetical protein